MGKERQIYENFSMIIETHAEVTGHPHVTSFEKGRISKGTIMCLRSSTQVSHQHVGLIEYEILMDVRTEVGRQVSMYILPVLFTWGISQTSSCSKVKTSEHSLPETCFCELIDLINSHYADQQFHPRTKQIQPDPQQPPQTQAVAFPSAAAISIAIEMAGSGRTIAPAGGAGAGVSGAQSTV
jgi:hypothetical protein